jgi:hypothetical protein
MGMKDAHTHTIQVEEQIKQMSQFRHGTWLSNNASLDHHISKF